ncbi:hypothetical protein PIIN_02541 [Serendipita indica DSM 11827]|uniref:Uncharacterized protein n=1 Tax=Serendipita indica (strain DSM 11827) TaxID=1109443 RepID=G4TBI3_SERID|nr:hypothetical protein PIIN_02541 [Serendipita indica DSM 11827]
MEILEKKARQSLLTCQPPLDMVEMILLSQEVEANELYDLACNNLAKSDIISPDNAKRIGVEALYKIISLKLAVHPQCTTCETGTASRCSSCIATHCASQILTAQKCTKCSVGHAAECSTCITGANTKCSGCSTTIGVTRAAELLNLVQYSAQDAVHSVYMESVVGNTALVAE